MIFHPTGLQLENMFYSKESVTGLPMWPLSKTMDNVSGGSCACCLALNIFESEDRERNHYSG